MHNTQHNLTNLPDLFTWPTYCLFDLPTWPAFLTSLPDLDLSYPPDLPNWRSVTDLSTWPSFLTYLPDLPTWQKRHSLINTLTKAVPQFLHRFYCFSSQKDSLLLIVICVLSAGFCSLFTDKSPTFKGSDMARVPWSSLTFRHYAF